MTYHYSKVYWKLDWIQKKIYVITIFDMLFYFVFGFMFEIKI